MPNSNLQVHRAIVAALRADATFQSICGRRIYDRVPVRPAVPYAAIGARIGQPFETIEMEGFELFVQIEVHDRHENGGSARAQSVMDAISAVLHNNEELPLDADNVVIAQMVSERLDTTSDLRTVHGVQRFRFVTHPD